MHQYFILLLPKDLTLRTYHVLFIYSSIDRHWVASTFQLLWIKFLWTSRTSFVWIYIFISLGYILKSGIAWSFDNCTYPFEKSQDCFPKQLPHFTILSVFEVPIFSTFSSTLIFFHLLILASLGVIKLYLVGVLICIYLMANEIEHLSMCLLATCIFSLEKCLFRFFSHFLHLVIFLFII